MYPTHVYVMLDGDTFPEWFTKAEDNVLMVPIEDLKCSGCRSSRYDCHDEYVGHDDKFNYYFVEIGIDKYVRADGTFLALLVFRLEFRSKREKNIQEMKTIMKYSIYAPIMQ
jgi:hypothetical protein